jgi:hypothetical protein
VELVAYCTVEPEGGTALVIEELVSLILMSRPG